MSRNRNATLAIAIVLMSAVVVFAAVQLFTREFRNTGTLVYGDIQLFANADLNEPLTLKDWGDIIIDGDRTYQFEYWISNTGEAPLWLEARAEPLPIGSNVDQEIDVNNSENWLAWSSRSPIAMQPTEFWHVRLTWSIPSNTATGGFDWNLIVAAFQNQLDDWN